MANEQRYIPLVPQAGTKVVDTHASPADQLLYDIPFRCNFRQIQIQVGTTEATAALYTLRKRITVGSDTGAVTIGTIAIPANTAAGKILYMKASARFQAVIGDQFVLALTTASTADKAGVVELLVDRTAEVAANEGDQVLSA